MLISISDVAGQVASVNAAYVIAVIVPNLITRGDGKCRVIFVGGVIEVSRPEAQRVIDVLERSSAAALPAVAASAMT